jgi:hypothetical protein
MPMLVKWGQLICFRPVQVLLRGEKERKKEGIRMWVAQRRNLRNFFDMCEKAWVIWQ